MAINIRCQKCSADMTLNSKKCNQCGTPVPKNKKYRVIVRVNGKRVSKTVNNLELAREIEGKLKVDIARGEFDLQKKKPAPTLDEVWDNFLPWAKGNKKTWLNDLYLYDTKIKPVFGSKTMDKITPFDIEGFIVNLKKSKSQTGRPYRPATIKHILILFKHLFSKSRKWGLYQGENPFDGVELSDDLKKLNNKINEHFNDDELERLHAVLDGWNDRMSACFIKFLLLTGLRRGELFKLQWSNIDLVKKTVLLKDPKGIEDQILPLSDKALDVLNEIPKEYDSSWIFYGKDGKQRTDFKGPWLRIRKAAELPKGFRLHGLRHHFASALVSNGVSLYTVQKLLCHKDAKTTMRYADLADKTLREAVQLSDTLQSPTKKADIINMGDVQNA